MPALPPLRATSGRPSWFHRALSSSARRPLLALALVVLALALPGTGQRELWQIDETRHAEALRNLRDHGDVLVLRVNDRPYGDKPPGWFLFVAGVQAVLRLGDAESFQVAAALSAVLFAWAAYALGRTVLKRRAAWALLAALAAVATPLCAFLARCTRMDLLFGALIVASQVAFFHALQRRGWRWWLLGGALSGLAVVTKGPFGFLLPFFALTAHAVITRRAWRVVVPGALVALLVALAFPAAWLAGIAATEGREYLGNMLRAQVLDRAVDASHHAKSPVFYLVVLPPMLLPWSLTWLLRRRARARTPAPATPAPRRRRPEGVRYLLTLVVVDLLLLSAVSTKFAMYATPLLPPLLLLTLDRLRLRQGARRFAVATFLMLVLLAMGAVLGDAFAERWGMPFEIPNLGVLAAAFAGAGLVVLAVRAARPACVVAVTCLALGAVGAVVAVVVVPGTDGVMSPRRQAEILKSYVDRGYEPFVFHVYKATYGYHVGRSLPDTNDREALAAFLARHERVVVAVAEPWWRREPGLFADLRVIDRQWLFNQPHLLLVRDTR